jgi:TP901 family phage tail tape measure protein
MSRTAGLTIRLNNYAGFKAELATLDKVIADIDRRIDRVGDGFTRLERSLGRSNFGRFAQHLQKVDSSLAGAASGAIQTNNAFTRLEGGMQDIQSEVTRIGGAFNRLESSMDLTATAQKLDADLARVGGSINAAGQDAQQAMSRFGGLADTLESVGTRVSLAISAPAIAMKAFAADAAIDFQNSMVNAGSVLGQTQAQMAGINEEILQMGIRAAAGPQAVADAYYEVVSGVQNTSTHMAILQAAINTSEAGQASLTSTTQGLIAVMNAYDLEADQASKVSDIFTQTMAMGVGSMEQFVTAMTPAAGLAYDVGISFEEVAAATAFLTSTGGTASESVTQLMGIMSAFLKPNGAMIDALEDMGYANGTAALQALGLQGSVQALYDAVGNTDGLAKALGTQEALQGSVGLLNERSVEFTNNFIAGIDGATAASRRLQQESPAYQMHLFQAALNGAGIALGKAFLPALLQGQAVLTDWLNAFTNADPSIQQFIAGIVTLAAVAGPSILILSQFVTAFEILGGIALAPLLLPLAAVITVIGIAVSDIVNNVGGAQDAFEGFLERFSSLLSLVQSLGQSIGLVFAFIRDSLGLTERTFSPATEAFNFLSNAIDSVMGKLEHLQAFLSLFNIAAGMGDTAIQNANNAAAAARTDLLSQRRQLALEIKLETDEDALDDLQSRLDEVNEQLAELPAPLQSLFDQFAGTPLFESIFGEGDEGIAKAQAIVADMRLEIFTLKDSIGVVGQAFQMFFAGNFSGGFATLRDGVAETVGSVTRLIDVFRGDTGATDFIANFSSGLQTTIANINQLFQDIASGDFTSVKAALSAALSGVIQGAIAGINLLDGGGGYAPGAGGSSSGGLLGQIKTLLTDAANGDFSGIVGVLQNNIVSVIQLAFAGVAAILGGPVALVFGLGKLIVDIVVNDFLGIGTLLAGSGVLDILENAFQPIKDGISSIFQNLFGDETQYAPGAGAGGGKANPFKGIQDFFNPIITTMGQVAFQIGLVWNGVAKPALDTFVEGLKGFVTNFQIATANINTDSFIKFAQGLLNAFVILFGAIVVIGSTIVAAVLSGIGEALPALGSALGSFIDSASKILSGDFGGALRGVASGIWSLMAAVGGFALGIADGFINFIETVANIQLPSAKETIGIWVENIKMLWQILKQIPAVQSFSDAMTAIGDAVGGLGTASPDVILGDIGTAIDKLKDSVAQFTLHGFQGITESFMKLLGLDISGVKPFFDNLLRVIDNPLQAIQLAFTNVGIAIRTAISQWGRDAEIELARIEFIIQRGAAVIEQATGIQTGATANAEASLRRGVTLTGAGEAIEALQSQIATGAIDLSVPLSFEFADYDFNLSLGQILNNPEYAAQLGAGAKDLFEQAINTAATNADFSTVGQLLNSAITQGIDLTGTDLNLSGYITELVQQGFTGTDLASVGAEFGAAGLGTQFMSALQESITTAAGTGELDIASTLMEGLVLSSSDAGIGATTEIATQIATQFNEDLATAFIETVAIPEMSEFIPIEDATALGTSIIEGLTLGLSDATLAIEAANATALETMNALNGAFGVQSPSTLTQQTGLNLIEGLALGMTANIGLIDPALQFLVGKFNELTLQVGMQMNSLQFRIFGIGMAMMVSAGIFAGQAAVMTDSITKTTLAVHELVAAIGLLTLVAGLAGVAGVGIPVPAMAAGGRGGPGLYRVAEPSIGGIEYLTTDEGGSFIVSSTNFEAFPAQPAQGFNYVPPPAPSGGGGNSAEYNSVQYHGDIIIQTYPGQTVTPDVIYEGLQKYHQKNPPQRRMRNNF